MAVGRATHHEVARERDRQEWRGPLQHHQRWKIQLRADDGDRSVHEHELLCMTLELSGCYDQLDLSVLAGIELVVRRLQLIEESKAAGG